MFYYDKYLKYKKKYIQFKKYIGGADYINKNLYINKQNTQYNNNDILWWNDPTLSFSDAKKDFTISSCARHIFKIVNCDIINKLNEIDTENYIICIHYNNNANDYKDIQLGITETPKKDESNEKTAQRGIYEEVGILFNKNLLINTKIECNFIPINTNISQYDFYIIDISNNLNQIISPKSHSEKFSTHPDTNSKKAFIILYGTLDKLEIMLKSRLPQIHEMYDNSDVESIQKEINIYNNKLSIIVIKKNKFIELAKLNSNDINELN